MKSRISGSGKYAGLEDDMSDRASRNSGSGEPGGSSRRSRSLGGHTDSLASFRSAQQARAERDTGQDYDLASLQSYVSNAFSDHSVAADARPDRESSGKANEENASLKSFVSYLFADDDDHQSHASLYSNHGPTYAAASPSYRTGDADAIWGMDRAEYEAVQREEGMPSMEDESTRSDTASVLSDASQRTYHTARTHLSDASGGSSRPVHSDRQRATPSLMETARALAAGSERRSTGSDESDATSNRRLRRFARSQLSADVASLISTPSNSTEQARSRNSRQSQTTARTANSTRVPSAASGHSDRTQRSTANTASILARAQRHVRWIPPRSQAPNLTTIQDDIEGDEWSHLQSGLSRLSRDLRQRVLSGASEATSRLRQDASYKQRRTEIRSARDERENSMASVSSGSSRESDSQVVARLRGETWNAVTPSDGRAIDRSSATLDDLTRYTR
jgi:hypothetical protein